MWFWAPWCEICNHEAPAIERLAADARGELSVVAIGGRDRAANGPAFVARHGLRTPTLLFDESMASWEAYRIVGQPGAVLLDRRGRERGRWSGALDTRLALAWTQLGVQRYTTRPGRTSREEGRALIGFIDGSTNLNPRNSPEDRRLVFVDPSPEAIATYPQNPPPEPGPVGPYGELPNGPRFPSNLATVPTREPRMDA